ncbi:hypothetical protein QOT17_007609 [Balamuthia mandrillaris]
MVATSHAVKGGLAALSWIVLNIGLSFINKYLFDVEDFKYPIFIILLGTVVTFLGTLFLMYVPPLLSSGWDVVGNIEVMNVLQHWRLLCMLAFLHAATTALSNISMVFISISLGQIIKATTPALTMLLSKVFENKPSSPRLVTATMIIIVGAAITVSKSPEFYGQHVHEHLFGLLCSVLSTGAGAGQVVVSAILLQQVDVSSWGLLLTTCIPTMLFLFPPFLYFEFPRLISSPSSSSPLTSPHDHTLTFFLVAIGGIGAFCYTLSAYLLIQYTSSIYSSIIGNLKVVLLVFLSMFVFGTQWNAFNMTGVVIALFGFLLYNYFKMTEPPLSSLPSSSPSSAKALLLEGEDEEDAREDGEEGEAEEESDQAKREKRSRATSRLRKGHSLMTEEEEGEEMSTKPKAKEDNITPATAVSITIVEPSSLRHVSDAYNN